MVDVTGRVAEIVVESKVKNGLATVFVSGSTASVTTLEFEPGLKQDIPEILDKFLPQNKVYHHDDTWGDGNGYAHICSAWLGTSFSVPIEDSRMTLGTWQQIVVIDHDNRARTREVVVQVLGE